MSTEYSFTAKEESIDCHGLNFLCLYGKHINGGFVAIINWGVAAELSAHKSDLVYNRDKILDALERSPYVSWLPADEEARSAVARDLAAMVGERIEHMQSGYDRRLKMLLQNEQEEELDLTEQDEELDLTNQSKHL